MWPTKFENMLECFVNLVLYLWTKSLRTLNFSLFCPYFFYCNLVWASAYRTNLSRLVILPKRVVRTIAKTQCYPHTDPIFKNLGILKFYYIHLLQLGLFMYFVKIRTLPSKFDCKFTLNRQIHSLLQGTLKLFVYLSVGLTSNNFPFLTNCKVSNFLTP